MMSQKRLYIIGIVLLVLVAITYLFRNRKQRINWRETYLVESEQPYGIKFLIDFLNANYQETKIRIGRKKIVETLLKPGKQKENYLFIGSGLWVDSMDVEALLRYVDQGNNALIASKAVSPVLMDKLFSSPKICGTQWNNYSSYESSKVSMSLYHPQVQADSQAFYHQFYDKKTFYRWNYIGRGYLCGMEAGGLLPIGFMADSLVNFAIVKYGEGNFFFHTNPIVFTNYNLIDDDRLDYIKGVFSHFSEGRFYIDNFSNVPENAVNPYARAKLNEENPLQYILSQPALAWAWYILLAMGILYLIFRSKRRQRIIPINEKNENTSLEFLATIGRLHFLNNSHKYLAEEKNRLFKAFISRRYQLKGKHLDEQVVERLAAKSQISKGEIRKIIMIGKNVEESTFVSKDTLINFHQALDYFYKNCR